LACNIKWNEVALMSQFQGGLQDDVRDLLLSLPHPQMLNEAISQVVKCNNWLFQRWQDQQTWNSSKWHVSFAHSIASTNVRQPTTGIEDM